MADPSKTEKPTARKQQKAREEGQFARARDGGPLAATLGVLGILVMTAPRMVNQVRVYWVQTLSEPYDFVHGDAHAAASRAFTTLLMLAGPPALAAAVCAGCVGVYLAGWNPIWKLAMPNFSRMAPLPKLKQMFTPGPALIETLTSLARITIVGWMAYGVLRDAFPVLTRLVRVGIADSARQLVDLIYNVVLRTCGAMLILTVADYAYNKYKVEKSLMMSKSEVKDEFKQLEGDQRIKGKMRAIGRARLRRGIAAAMKKADVVLANPTHVSVALRYRPEDGAPVVVAKGYDDIALYIRELARKQGVLIVESPPLARALAKRVKVGKPIPVDLYAAVAEVLAFVYRVRRRAVGVPRPGERPASPPTPPTPPTPRTPPTPSLPPAR